MASTPDDPTEPTIADLVHQLVEDGGDVVRAELNLYREVVLYRIEKVQTGAIALIAGALLVLAALTVLLVMVAIGLALHIGPVGAGLVVAGITAGVATLLLRYGAQRVGAVFGDDEEDELLAKRNMLP